MRVLRLLSLRFLLTLLFGLPRLLLLTLLSLLTVLGLVLPVLIMRMSALMLVTAFSPSVFARSVRLCVYVFIFFHLIST